MNGIKVNKITHIDSYLERVPHYFIILVLTFFNFFFIFFKLKYVQVTSEICQYIHSLRFDKFQTYEMP